MVKLDFSGLLKVADEGTDKTGEQQKKDALTERGYTVIEGEDLPFDEDLTPSESLTRTPAEPQAEPPSSSGSPAEDLISYRPSAPPAPSSAPARVEMRQILFPQDIEAFATMCRSGQIEIVTEDSVYYRKSGIFYAHFYLVSDPINTGKNRGKEPPQGVE